MPLSVHLELTYACNWHCVFCYNRRPHRQQELTLAQWMRVLDDLRELGTLTISLTGGEPLAHPQLLTIARAIRHRHFALRILSNGSLVDDEMAKAIADLRPLSFELSLHGANAASHDRTTRCEGSFNTIWEGVRRLKKHGIRLILKSPVTSLNSDEIDAMIELASRHELPLRLDTTLTPCDDGNFSPLRYAANQETIELVQRRLHQARQMPRIERSHDGTSCNIACLTMAIDPVGNVFPCIQWRSSSLGNVTEQRLTTLWSESPVRQQVQRIAIEANARLIKLGPEAATYPYCLALAAQLTGDPLQPDSRFLEHARSAYSLSKSQ